MKLNSIKGEGHPLHGSPSRLCHYDLWPSQSRDLRIPDPEVIAIHVMSYCDPCRESSKAVNSSLWLDFDLISLSNWDREVSLRNRDRNPIKSQDSTSWTHLSSRLPEVKTLIHEDRDSKSNLDGSLRFVKILIQNPQKFLRFDIWIFLGPSYSWIKFPSQFLSSSLLSLLVFESVLVIWFSKSKSDWGWFLWIEIRCRWSCDFRSSLIRTSQPLNFEAGHLHLNEQRRNLNCWIQRQSKAEHKLRLRGLESVKSNFNNDEGSKSDLRSLLKILVEIWFTVNLFFNSFCNSSLP